MLCYGGVIMEEDTARGNEDTQNPYFINCCGYVKIHNRNVSVKRTRVDYYLVYLIDGIGNYLINSSMQAVQAGNIVIFRKNDEQIYNYLANDKSEFYWIHFTGSAIEQLLSVLGLNGHVYNIGIHTEYINLFESIIHEIQLKNLQFHQLSISYLLQMLSAFSRKAGTGKEAGGSIRSIEIETIIKLMHLEYQKNHTVEFYAKKCNLSVYWFIRKFKSSTNISPARYIEKIRIDKARELLVNTDMRINEISDIVGFNDALYFSKVFKKLIGKNPLAYRKSIA